MAEQKPETKRRSPRTNTARKTRTLTLQQIPDDVKKVIQENRQLHETWQETAIRLIRTHKKIPKSIKFL